MDVSGAMAIIPAMAPLDQPDEVESTRMTVGEHLDELRTRILRSLLVMVLACLICIWPAKWLLVYVVARPVILVLERYNMPQSLLATSPIETIVMYIKVVLFCGIMLAAPYIIHQIWAFVAAGLYRREKAWVYKLVPVSIGLFFTGVVFMYTLVLLVSLNFLIGFSTWLPMPEAKPTGFERALLGSARTSTQPTTQPDFSQTPRVAIFDGDPDEVPDGVIWFDPADDRLKIRFGREVHTVRVPPASSGSMITTHFKIGEYLSFLLVMTVAFGLAFQIPLVVIFLVRTGIVPSAVLMKYRKIVILLIVVVAGMIAPPDLLSHVLLSGPMLLLFEIGLWFARRGEQAAAEQKATTELAQRDADD